MLEAAGMKAATRLPGWAAIFYLAGLDNAGGGRDEGVLIPHREGDVKHHLAGPHPPAACPL